MTSLFYYIMQSHGNSRRFLADSVVSDNFLDSIKNLKYRQKILRSKKSALEIACPNF